MQMRPGCPTAFSYIADDLSDVDGDSYMKTGTPSFQVGISRFPALSVRESDEAAIITCQPTEGHHALSGSSDGGTFGCWIVNSGMETPGVEYGVPSHTEV